MNDREKIKHSWLIAKGWKHLKSEYESGSGYYQSPFNDLVYNSQDSAILRTIEREIGVES